MGPTILFDKSFLQSLKLDESVWLDHFFISNISPLFYVETLADIAKPGSRGRSAAEEVRIIADKFPQLNSGPCAHHYDLCIGNLLGQELPMSGIVPLSHSKLVSLDGQQYGVAGESPVADAFYRWQEGRFADVERGAAREWREALNGHKVADNFNFYEPLGINPRICKSLDETRAIADQLVSMTDSPDLRISLALSVLGIQEIDRAKILARWAASNQPALKVFAPYAAYAVCVQMFIDIGMGSGLISTKRRSNWTDIAYLFYLPFCKLFISSDKLHRKISSFFLRDDQKFVWGPDLKVALAAIDFHFKGFPENDKEKDIYSLAPEPPRLPGNLVNALWEHTSRRWQSIDAENELHIEAWKGKRKQAEALQAAEPLQINPTEFRVSAIKGVTMKRRITKRRGSWYQVAKNFTEQG